MEVVVKYPNLEKLKNLLKEDQEKIRKAYEYAKIKHQGQKRESGEEYIIHPLEVANIIAEFYPDPDTICACLLHDTLEDTTTSKLELEILFNKTVAELVDGVTKISRMNFHSKKEQNLANTRKIITSIQKDIRIILIKLADRLHNMRTLEYKKREKQIENAYETLEIFVPLAYYLGVYRIKSELEDLSLYYLKQEEYRKYQEIASYLQQRSYHTLESMKQQIMTNLRNENMDSNIKIRSKNVYGIYQSLHQGKKLQQIHDLFSLKVMVPTKKDCYISLGIIHQLYRMMEGRFKDYIANPKTNLYQSLHTTVFGLDQLLTQIQIRTNEMDEIASFGLPAYWMQNGNREEKGKNLPFRHIIEEVDQNCKSNEEFLKEIKKELFQPMIYVYNPDGTRIEIKEGTTLKELKQKMNITTNCCINGKIVNENYLLQNKDYLSWSSIIVEDSIEKITGIRVRSVL